ncbi:uncharacterized protein LOC130719638 [Lotus japonicus]|uniref:uncharacterized protein LOC130719638 n=1 Tax=Lotus japonicus TaxID=34305 RepID=UPI0025857BFA|nr:uncharacterized protein LOC130719638 [Lotus japonicus]
MTWFTTLPPRSIAGFMDLSAKFLSQFSTSRAQKVTPAALFNLQQRHNESLQSFMGRFNQLSVHLEDKMPEICIAAFELGLQSGSLNSSLSRKPVETMAELRSRVQGFIREEQSDRIKRNRKSAAVVGQQQQSDSKKAAVNDQCSGGAVTKGERGYNNSSRFDNRSNFRNRAQPYGNRGYGQSMTWTRNQQDRSTPLAVNLTEALHMCLEANTIRFPKQPKRPPGNVDRSKWCEYHRIAGHNTDDCFTLKKEIEALIKAGYMRQLEGRKESEGARTSTKRDDTGKEIEESEPRKQAGGETKGRIHSIFGGFRGGGVTNSSRKRYVHSINAVYTNDWGSWGINQPYITFTLGLTEADLLSYDGALVGFSGEKVFVRGYVELSTVFGEGKNEKAFAIKFLVVQCTSPYNVLIGRPSLNKMGAIISTRHLTVKYPLDKGGVGTLKADQVVARKCYSDSFKQYGHMGKRAVKEGHRVFGVDVDKEEVSLDPREGFSDFKMTPEEETKTVKVGERNLKVGVNLTQIQESRLVQLLAENMDLFAWSARDLPGIDPEFICHKLALNPSVKPIAS